MAKRFNNLLFYSTNAKLAYHINQRFYNGKHFVWCSPVFDTAPLSDDDVFKRIPSSSNPWHIYQSLKNDVEQDDRHSSKIANLKNGLATGAEFHRNNNSISNDDYDTIMELIAEAGILMFMPLLYVIPKNRLGQRIVEVSVTQMANPLSVEYQIHDLDQSEFDIIRP